MKKFFKDKDNLIILTISLIVCIVGCFAIKPILSILIILIADLLFFSPDIIKSLKGGKKKSKEKSKTKQEKSKKKKIARILIIGFFACCILAIVGSVLFAGYIVSTAPKFNPKKLYAQEPSILYDANGDEIGKLGSQKRKNITYDDLPEVLIDAIIATEDSNFFQHNGVDLSRFLVASFKQVLTGGGGGASTLTMQVVKNTFTSTASSGFEGIKRKFTDMYMSVFQVEKKYTKKEILEFYVNSYYLGSGAYGVEQASKTYFGKSAKDLNLAEAALIAGLFQAPNAYDPFLSPEKAIKRRNQVLGLMKRHNYITDEEYKIAKSIKIEDMLDTESNSVSNKEWQAFIDLVVNEVVENTGYDPYTTSMKIYTTMDKEKQAWLNNIMDGKTFDWANDYVDAGISVQDVNTGEIVAIGAGRNRVGERQYITATQIKKQIGSTSKPLYDYAPGIEYENWSTYTLFADEEYSYSDGTPINNWDRRFNGLMTMRTALAQSRNIPALKAFKQNKNSNILEFVKKLGLHPEESNGIIHEAHSIGGYTGENPRDMAAAYAAFGNGGYYIKPHSYRKIIINENNKTIEPTYEKEPVMSEDTAYMMTSLLQSSAQQGLGAQANVGGAIFGAKTGTSNYDTNTIKRWGFGENAVNDLWVNAVSPDYAISVWYGYKERTEENKAYTSTSFTISHRTLFQAVAKGIFKKGSSWSKPEGVTEVQVEFGSWPAKLPSEFTPEDKKVTELFKVGTEPTEISDMYSKLENVSNLTGTVSDNKLVLKWDAIKTPNAISSEYASKYTESIFGGYKNYSIDENINRYGSVIYKVYSKDSSGNLKHLTDTESTTTTIDVDTNSPTTYVVISSYSKYTNNMSDGSITNISLDNVKAKLSIQLADNVKQSEDISKNDTYKVNTSDIVVTADGKDITSKAKVSITINDKETTNIDTTKTGSYTIKYKAIYNDETLTTTRVVNVK